MKIKKKSIIIPAFALLIGASLAGSISGTVAWYQYSTRVNAAYVGVSGGTSGNLQIKLGNGDWSTRLTKEDIAGYLADAEKNPNKYGSAMMPITSGDMGKDSAVPENFYLNPSFGQGDYSLWTKADKTNYIVLPLKLRYVERDGVKENSVDEKNVAKDVFLTDLLLQEDYSNETNNKEDLSDAIRFHISSYVSDAPTVRKNRLISKNGGTTITNGKLDLDGDGNLDTAYPANDKYGFKQNSELAPVIYGSGSQIAFTSAKSNITTATPIYNPDGTTTSSDALIYSMVADSEGSSLDIKEASKNYDEGKSKSIGSTIADAEKVLCVDVTIWIEGWQTFVNSESKHVSMWDEVDYISSKFNVGFEFGVDQVE